MPEPKVSYGELNPSSIRKRMKLMIEFDAKVKTTGVTISHYSKHSFDEVMEIPKEERFKCTNSEYIMNSKGKGFNIAKFNNELAQFISEYLQSNDLPEADINQKTILMS